MPSTTERGLERARFFDGDDAVLADLVHRLGDDLADRLVVVRRDGADLGDHVAAHRLGHLLELGRDRLDRLLDAALHVHRVRAGDHVLGAFAVVVPSPAMSDVLLATSRTICAPMFSSGSLRSISLATVTPSLVMVGDPNFLSRTTLRPFGPSVTLTASASWLTPRSTAWRDCSPYTICFAISLFSCSCQLSA